MLKFKYIRWKNFLSTGDNFTHIKLDEAARTLITGANGCGKSTLLDALSFALFGKPHRNINKPQLVNSINEKDCLVEVEFSIGKMTYKIRRGIHPGIFEIYKNNAMIPQSSTVRDYQRYLEQNILKLNHRTFHQVVVLGSSSFIPFMQLPTGARRDVIEDLLDINVFSKMNKLLKEEVSGLKEDMTRTDYEIRNLKNKRGIQEKYITDLETMNDDLIAEKEAEIKENEKEGIRLTREVEKLEKKIKAGQAELKKRQDSYDNARGTIDTRIRDLKAEIKRDKKALRFFEEHDECPTCTQSISPEIKEANIRSHNTELRDQNLSLMQAEGELTDLQSKMDNLDGIRDLISDDETQSRSYSSEIRSIMRAIKAAQADIIKLQKKSGDIEGAKEDLAKIIEDLLVYQTRKSELNEDLTYHTLILEMLKDTGIKTKIIRQYLPVMNQLINQYLQVLDFFVSFHLDENFNEVIKSRYRDEFSYASFSEGEKQRINLALLFAWRQVAKMKNSVATNLLILDETFDSSLDNDGVENLMKILDTLDENSNVFVISHKGHLLAEKFENGMTFEKVNNFSVMRYS